MKHPIRNLCSLSLILAFVSHLDAEERKLEGRVTALVTDKDGWGEASVSLYRHSTRRWKEGDVEKSAKTKELVASTVNLYRGKFAATVPPGRYHLSVTYRGSSPAQSDATTVFEVNDKETVPHKFYFEKGRVTAQVTDKDGWGEASVSLYRHSTRRWKEGDVEKSAKTKELVASTVNLYRGKFAATIPPGRYHLSVTYRGSSPAQSDATTVFEVNDKETVPHKFYFEKGRVTAQVTDKDGWGEASVSLYRHSTRRWKEGDVEKSAKTKELVASTVNLYRGKFAATIPPGRYHLSVTYRGSSPAQSDATTVFEVNDKETAAWSLKFSDDGAESHVTIRGGEAVRPLDTALQEKHALGPGIKGVFLSESLNGLPKDIVIESLFHRSVESPDHFWSTWNSQKKGAQILVGYWQHSESGAWERHYKMVVFPQYYKPVEARQQYAEIVGDLPSVERSAIAAHQDVRTDVSRRVAALVTASPNVDRDKFVEIIDELRNEYRSVAESPGFTTAKNSLITQVTDAAPVAQKILFRTIQNATDDREKLVVDLTKATITGGASLGPLIVDHTLNASFEVLSEEGLITADQASALNAASSFLQAINGAAGADNIVDIVGALNDGHDGLVEIGVVDDGDSDGRMTATIKTGSEVLEFLILLK